MEAFELTFFYPRGRYDEKSIEYITEKYKQYDSFGVKSIVDFFSDEGKDFDEFRICIFDFRLRKDNFESIFVQLSQCVGSILNEMEDVYFVTGIYELTYYFTEHKIHINEFDEAFMQKFPIVFYRTDKSLNTGKVIYSDKNITCVFHEGAQNLY